MKNAILKLAATSIILALSATLVSADFVYVSNEKDNSLSVIDTKTMSVIKTIPVGERPRGIIFSKDHKRLYICASDSDTVQVMDVATGKILHNLPSGDIHDLADLPKLKNTIIINARSMRRDLRSENCRPNILHTIPSRAMLADAMMQFLTKKRWTRIFLIEGPRAADALYADAIRSSAKKFRLAIVADKKWPHSADMRRNASAEIPALTQDAKYDILLVTDESRDFGQYILYNTWHPRPVGGSHGLKAVAWSRAVEQWGAVQLQNRFDKLSHRPMGNIDYAAWAGIRAIAEAITRTRSVAPKTLNAFLRGPELRLAIYKGRSSSFRSWNGQMRQSIPLVHAQALVANAPFEGFLHPKTELDTLGLDEPESKCK